MTISYKHRNNTFKNSNGDNVTHKDILLKVDGVEQVLSTPLIVTGVGSLLSKTDDGFKDRLKEIKKSAGKNNTIKV